MPSVNGTLLVVVAMFLPWEWVTPGEMGLSCGGGSIAKLVDPPTTHPTKLTKTLPVTLKNCNLE
jgi:hypothetical protein